MLCSLFRLDLEEEKHSETYKLSAILTKIIFPHPSSKTPVMFKVTVTVKDLALTGLSRISLHFTHFPKALQVTPELIYSSRQILMKPNSNSMAHERMQHCPITQACGKLLFVMRVPNLCSLIYNFAMAGIVTQGVASMSFI